MKDEARNIHPDTVQQSSSIGCSSNGTISELEPEARNEPTPAQAWLQAALCHLINLNSFGYILSFGIFQTYYRSELGFSPSHTSWIGTLQLFMLFFVGAFSGRAVDAGYYRYTLVLGQICQLVGVFTTSACSKYYQILLAQGILQGLRNGLLSTPSLTLVTSYFPPNRRALPLSLLACGGATGGMVFPAMAQNLLPKLGFAWTVRCMGFVMLAVHAIALPFLKPRPVRERRDLPWLDPTAARDAPYLLFCVGVFLALWGLVFPYFYARSYAREQLGISDEASFNLILIINSVGIPGRVVPNYLADRYFGALNVHIPFVLITGALILSWIGVRSPTGYYVWVAIYGFWGGGVQSLFQAAAASFSNNPEQHGIRIGIVCTIASFACLSGAPIAGKLLEVMDGGYLAAQIFNGVVIVVGSIFLLAAKIVQRRQRRLEV